MTTTESMSETIATPSLRAQSDETLARFAASGSVKAFETIVERYRGPLTRTCAGTLPAAIVDDAVQQTFVNAWTALHRGAEVRDVRAWLYEISRNCGYRLLRQANCSDQIPHDTACADGVHDILERKLLLRAALDAVAALPDRQRLALVSTAVDGHSGHHAAAVLGVNESTLRQLVRRARVTLRASAAAACLPVSLVRFVVSRAAGLMSQASLAPGSDAAGTIAKAAAILATATATLVLPIVHHTASGAGAGLAYASDTRGSAPAATPIDSPPAYEASGTSAGLRPSQPAASPSFGGVQSYESFTGPSGQGVAYGTPTGGFGPSLGTVGEGPGAYAGASPATEPIASEASTHTPFGPPSANEPPPSEPAATEQPAGEPSAGETGPTEPPPAEPPASESPPSESPPAESPPPEQPASEQPTSEQPAGEQSSSGQPSTEQPAAEPAMTELPLAASSFNQQPASGPTPT